MDLGGGAGRVLRASCFHYLVGISSVFHIRHRLRSGHQGFLISFFIPKIRFKDQRQVAVCADGWPGRLASPAARLPRLSVIHGNKAGPLPAFPGTASAKGRSDEWKVMGKGKAGGRESLRMGETRRGGGKERRERGEGGSVRGQKRRGVKKQELNTNNQRQDVHL